MSRRRRNAIVRITARLSLLLTVSIATGCSRPERPRPSILLVSIDTLRADRLNAYGYGRRQTSPALDALARDAVLFEHHQAASPWTTPSHLSLLTALSPTRHGVTASYQDLTTSLRKGEGYQRLSDRTLTLAEALRASGWTTAAFTGGATLDPRIGFGHGFESYETNMEKLNRKNIGALLAWIQSHQDRPFFLFWHTFEVHAPYLRGTFLDDVLPPPAASSARRALRRFARQPGRKVVQEGWDVLAREGLATTEVCQALYDGGVRWTDDALAQVIAGLRELGLYDDMLIIVTSDHGEELGDRPAPVPLPYPGWGFYNTHGHTLYEEMIRIPLLLKLPGNSAAGRSIGAVTRAIDVMPTVLDVTGVRVAASLEGTSLRPLWQSSAPAVPRTAFSEALARQDEKKSLRDDRYKYIVTVDPKAVAAHGRQYLPPEPAARALFDLRRDPGERRNLLASADAAAHARAAAMDAALRRMILVQGTADRVDRSEIDVEALRALGYVQ